MLWLLVSWSVRVIDSNPTKVHSFTFSTRPSDLGQKKGVLTPAVSAELSGS